MFYSLNADRTGLEPATSAVTGRHSNQLNYRSVLPCGAAKIEKNSYAANKFLFNFNLTFLMLSHLPKANQTNDSDT